MREELVVRVEEVLAETKSRVRIEDECGQIFWTARGVRQRYPLSTMLFNLVFGGSGRTDEKGEVERGDIGRKKFSH